MAKRGKLFYCKIVTEPTEILRNKPPSGHIIAYTQASDLKCASDKTTRGQTMQKVGMTGWLALTSGSLPKYLYNCVTCVALNQHNTKIKVAYC